jgi:O-antigen/teichoic acid export membrane protein
MRISLYNKTKKQLLLDILTSLSMVILLVLIGAFLFFIIASFYPPASVGVFNQAYAMLIVFGQVATIGIQNAVLYQIPTALGEKEQINKTLSSALFVVIGSSISISLVLYMLSGFVSRILESVELGVALKAIAPAVFFFAINKILLNSINGLQLMRSYAVFSSARIGLLLIFSLLIIYLKLPGQKLSLIFVCTEVVLMITLITFIHRQGLTLINLPDVRITKSLLRFGVRSLGVGILHELNTRIDILMLGYFLLDKTVGIYTLPAVIIESVLLIMYSARRNIDPIISRLHVLNEGLELRRFTFSTIRISLIGSLGLCVILGGTYQIIIHSVPNLSIYQGSQQLLWILLIGGALWGGFVPVSGMFIQLGRPGWQTVLITFQAALNITLNSVLIPHFSAMGAALATAVTLMATTGMYLLLLFHLPQFRQRGITT